MGKYRKVDPKIWNDAKFNDLSVSEKLRTLKQITYNNPTHDFARFAGPAFRIADTPKRRPDLYSAEWREKRLVVIQEEGAVCRYCGADCSEDTTVDHIVPVGKGGRSGRANLAVSCRPCNSRKGGKEGWL
ncbi:MAG: HNH endonuclease [Deltaproteobacteria bacterium]|nr:HNH endonuclease [Deltaproteobacteria bacterium]